MDEILYKPQVNLSLEYEIYLLRVNRVDRVFEGK